MKEAIFLFFFVTLTQIYSGNGNPPSMSKWATFRPLSRSGSGLSASSPPPNSYSKPPGPLLSLNSRSGSDSPGSSQNTYRSSSPSSPPSGGLLIGGSGDIGSLTSMLRSASGRFGGSDQSSSVRPPPNRSSSSPPAYGSYNSSKDTNKDPGAATSTDGPRSYYGGPLPRQNSGPLPRQNSGPLPRQNSGPLPRQNSGYGRPNPYSSPPPKPPTPEPATPPQPRAYSPYGSTAPPKPTSYSPSGGGDCGLTFTQQLKDGKEVAFGIKNNGLDKETISNMEKTMKNAITEMDNEYRVALVTKYS